MTQPLYFRGFPGKPPAGSVGLAGACRPLQFRRLFFQGFMLAVEAADAVQMMELKRDEAAHSEQHQDLLPFEFLAQFPRPR
jgi:hypothetical protein